MARGSQPYIQQIFVARGRGMTEEQLNSIIKAILATGSGCEIRRDGKIVTLIVSVLH